VEVITLIKEPKGYPHDPTVKGGGGGGGGEGFWRAYSHGALREFKLLAKNGGIAADEARLFCGIN